MYFLKNFQDETSRLSAYQAWRTFIFFASFAWLVCFTSVIHGDYISLVIMGAIAGIFAGFWSIIKYALTKKEDEAILSFVDLFTGILSTMALITMIYWSTNVAVWVFVMSVTVVLVSLRIDSITGFWNIQKYDEIRLGAVITLLFFTAMCAYDPLWILCAILTGVSLVVTIADGTIFNH